MGRIRRSVGKIAPCPTSILSANLADVELETSSIPPDWILSGNPETRSKILGRSHDLLAHIIVWECGAVSYRWHYSQDEAYIVLSGEGFMNDEKGVERRLGPGDVAFFPAEQQRHMASPRSFQESRNTEGIRVASVGNWPEVMEQASANDRDN